MERMTAMTSYEVTLVCDVRGCCQSIAGASERTHEKARMDAEAVARNKGWIVDHDFGYPLHICRSHAEDSYYNNEQLNEIHQKH
jgi:hypothetical protein